MLENGEETGKKMGGPILWCTMKTKVGASLD